MNRLTVAIICALSGLIATPSWADSYTVDPKHTFPSFEIGHLGFSTQRGRFNTSSGSITLDRAAHTLSADIRIDAASIDTGLAALEEHLRGPDFFNVEMFPELRFVGATAKFDGDRPVVLNGELTLLGVSRPVLLLLNNFKCGPHPKTQKEHCGADASAVIKRSDFGMNYALPAIADSVRLLIQVEAVRNDAP